MKVYSVHLSHLNNGLDMSYGTYSTMAKAIAKAKEKPLNFKEPDMAGLNVTIVEHTIDTEREDVVCSWILRENGEYTPETDDDKYNWLIDNQENYGYTLADE